ncbi:hypothetical protein Tco_0154000 [Tanacetum coccineum]
MQTEHTNSSNGINIVSTPVSTAGPSFDTAVPLTLVNTAGPSDSTANESEEQLFKRFYPFKNAFTLPPVPNISSMDNTSIFGNAYDDEDVEEEVDMNNVISSYTVHDNSFTKFHKDQPEDQVIGISELAACLENASYSCTSGHVEVYQNSASHLSSLKFTSPQTSLCYELCSERLQTPSPTNTPWTDKNKYTDLKGRD